MNAGELGWPALVAAAAVLLWPGPHRHWQGPDPTLPRLRRVVGRSTLRRLAARLPPVRHVRAAPAASDLADSLVLLALALRSGLGLVEALHEVVGCSTGRVREDLAAVVAALRWGRSTAQAWAFAGPAWRPVAQVMQLAEETGAAPAEVVSDTAVRLRELHERELESRAARAGVLLVLPLGLAFLPAFACTAIVPIVVALARGVVAG